MTDTKLLDRPVTAIRRTRRAYLGALGLSYDFAVARAEKRRDQITTLFGELVSRGETLETEAKVLFERAKTEARELTGTAAEAVKEVADDVVEQAQAVQRELTEETPAKATVKAKAPAKDKTKAKAKVKAPAKSVTETTDRYADHVAKVRAYDASADAAVIKRIVDHLGIALQSRDTRFVACSDEAERKTVAESWLVKKLGVTGDAAAMDARVMAVCETMKGDRMKDRVTFYYLLAKTEGKLAAL